MKRSSKDSKEPATPGSVRLQAAALPFRQRDRLEILLVSSLDTGRWIVPKGWPMKGRTIAQSALREAYEEAGVKGAIAPKPVGTFNYDKRRRNGAVLRCVVEVFPLEVKTQARTWPEKSARVLRWCDWAQAAELVDDAGLGDIIRTFAAARQPAMAG
jgi:8-oxo-dGTP pyrophosphatase MutT (NUDIX family)